jgi:NAD(P)-dependent dehydrogenase (short-subunit alcohol dehydrogenase family)
MDRVNSAAGLRTLIVGASSGIGREIAQQLANQGARVVAAARRLERLESLSGVTATACDVRDPQQCEAVVATAVEHLGGLDALVFAAGLSRITPLERPNADDWDAVFETNLFGPVNITRAAIPHLTSPDSQGRAVYLSSDASELAFPGLVAYSASKAALGRYCQGLADEIAGLRVSEVVVGPTAGTEIANGFDPADFEEWAVRWFEGGYVRHGMQQPKDVSDVVVAALVADVPAVRILAAGGIEDSATSLDEGKQQALQQSP